jgi:diacylglycerol kinase family enzyme
VDHGRDVIVSTPRRIELSVRGRKRVPVALDGEKLRMSLPLTIELAEELLRVILPSDRSPDPKTPR